MKAPNKLRVRDNATREARGEQLVEGVLAERDKRRHTECLPEPRDVINVTRVGYAERPQPHA